MQQFWVEIRLYKYVNTDPVSRARFSTITIETTNEPEYRIIPLLLLPLGFNTLYTIKRG